MVKGWWSAIAIILLWSRVGGRLLTFEAWTASEEDVAALRQAEENFLQGDAEDGRDEVPPDDEPIVPETSNYEQNVPTEPVLDMCRLPEVRTAPFACLARQGRQAPILYPVSKEAIPREEQASASDARRSSKASISRAETERQPRGKRQFP